MCIIICKPKKVSLPDEQTLKNCFINNPDGAGFMYSDGGKVIIEKGFMKFEKFAARIDEFRNRQLAMVLHFRIGTEGEIRPENTHPFPITNRPKLLEKLHLSTTLGMVHNGMIDLVPRNKKISDTMEYILGWLSILYSLDRDFYKKPLVSEAIEEFTTSKFAFLTSDNQITRLGTGWTTLEGLHYSNTTYKPSVYGMYKYDYEGWDSLTSETILMQEIPDTYTLIDAQGKLVGDNFEYYFNEQGIVYLVDYYSFIARKCKGYRVFDESNRVPVLDYNVAEYVSVE